jgi:hypothetical protein
LCRIAAANLSPQEASSHPLYKQAVDYVKTVVNGAEDIYTKKDNSRSIASFELDCHKRNYVCIPIYPIY